MVINKKDHKKKRAKKRKRNRPSSYYLLLGVTLALVFFGVIMITSSSSSLALTRENDSFYYLKRQSISVAIGLIAMFVVSRFDYRKIKRLSIVFLGLSIMLLAFAAISGKVIYGSSRWVALMGVTFQPSEIAKLAAVFFAASVLSNNNEITKKISKTLMPLGLPVLFISVLVLIQPDLGTTFAILITVFFMLFMAGARFRDLALIGTGGFAAGMIFIMTATYRRERFLAFLDPWNDTKSGGFQIIQSFMALGSGGLGGVGLGFSRQKFGYLPTPFTDFIFAIIGEELGLAGTAAVLILFIIFGFLGIKIAQRANDRFGQLLAGGITMMILVQAIINLGAVTGMLPITGIPLPLVSFGGSSLIVTLASIGVLLNISSSEKIRIARKVRIEGSNSGRRDGRTRLPRPSSGRSA